MNPTEGDAAIERPPRFEPRPGSIPTLPVPDAGSWRRLHLVGIGGAGMRGIARLLIARGIAVSGSDLKDSPGLDALRAAGATIFVGHRAEHVDRPDAVVVSSAVPPANPEVRRARDERIPVLARAQVLAALMVGQRTVAIAGTHGKTTTTSMISVMLDRSGVAPTFVIGGDLNESGSGAEHGAGDVFVAEADESDGSFLLLSPDIAVVTNVETDHVDFYRDAVEIDAAFAAFADRARAVVACWDDAGVRRSLAHSATGLLRYGESMDVDLRLKDVRTGASECWGVVEGRDLEVEVHLNVPGRHNLLNATAGLAVGIMLGLEPGVAARGLSEFRGVRRRFERRGAAVGALFVDDYAHHPTEVAATLATALASRSALASSSAGSATGAAAGGAGSSAATHGRVVAVFQPHRYTRTKAMWRELGESLSTADVVVLTDVYGAGEQPIPGVTGKLLVEALTEASPGKRVVYLPRRSDVGPFLASFVGDGDLVLTLGAGDITQVADETLLRLREQEEVGA